MRVEVRFFNRAAEQFPTLQSWQHVVGTLDEFALRWPDGAPARRPAQVERALFAHIVPRLLRLGWRIGHEIPLSNRGGGGALWPHIVRKRTALLVTQAATLPLLATLAKTELMTTTALRSTALSKRAVVVIAGDWLAGEAVDARLTPQLVSAPLAIAELRAGTYSPLQSREELYQRLRRARDADPEPRHQLAR